MIYNFVLIFVLVANLVRTNCHMFLSKMMLLNNWKTKEEEEKWVDHNWKTL